MDIAMLWNIVSEISALALDFIDLVTSIPQKKPLVPEKIILLNL